jgi:hypothetical protein
MRELLADGCRRRELRLLVVRKQWLRLELRGAPDLPEHEPMVTHAQTHAARRLQHERPIHARQPSFVEKASTRPVGRRMLGTRGVGVRITPAPARSRWSGLDSPRRWGR